MSKTKKIYYITREGRKCKTSGIRAYMDELKDKYSIILKDFILIQGITLNDPKRLIQELKENNDTIIILSMPEKSAYIFDDKDTPNNIKDNIIPMLEREYNNDNSKTSWEIIYNDFRKTNIE